MTSGLSEAWRHAAREVSGLGKGTTQFREDVADAAVRVALEGLLAGAGTIWTNGVAVRAVTSAAIERELAPLWGRSVR